MPTISRSKRRVVGFAWPHSNAASNKTAQPFPAGLLFVVADVHAQVAIGSHSLHQQIADIPNRCCNPRLHRRRDTQRLVDAAKVVVSEMQAVSRPQVLPLFAEGIRQPSEPPHLHADGQILSLHVGRANGCLFCACGFGGPQTGPNPTDRAKLGSKRHLICDGQGIPFAIRLTGANRNDSQEALALVDAIPPLQGRRGRPCCRPDCVLGYRAYDAGKIRSRLRATGNQPLLARRNTDHGGGLGRWRWVVERTFAWLNQFCRLRIRYEKRADIHEAFLALGCALICWRFLAPEPPMG